LGRKEIGEEHSTEQQREEGEEMTTNQGSGNGKWRKFFLWRMEVEDRGKREWCWWRRRQKDCHKTVDEKMSKWKKGSCVLVGCGLIMFGKGEWVQAVPLVDALGM
jgi:hypothetical protein